MKPRRTLRETLAATQSSLDLYAALSGKPRVIVTQPEPAKPRKPRDPQSNGNPTEAQILKAVLAFLRRHPKVAIAYRVNSGTFREGERFIRANTQRGMTDICGTLKDGRALYVEVKSATGRVQPHQQAFIDKAAAAGALAGIVRSVDDTQELLKNA